MPYEYDCPGRYSDEWYGRVPFYWRSVKFWQTAFTYGEGVLWFMGTAIFYVAAFCTFGGLSSISLWWLIGVGITAMLLITQATFTAMIATSERVSWQRMDDLNINNYYKLPKKIRKELKPLARYVNGVKGNTHAGMEEIKKWSKLVDGHLKLNPYVPPTPKTSRKLQQASKRLNTLLELNEEEQARIADQKKIEAEIDKEVRERVKAQLKLEGKEYLELHV